MHMKLERWRPALTELQLIRLSITTSSQGTSYPLMTHMLDNLDR